MTEEQIKKCIELSAERDNLIDFRNYLTIHKDGLWEVSSDNDGSVVIPDFFHDMLISNAERWMDIIEERLKEL